MSVGNFSDRISGEHEFDLKREFLIYLDLDGILNELKVVGPIYESSIQPLLMEGIFIPPFRFLLKTDLLRIQEISGKLFRLIVEEPKKALEIARELVYYALREMTSLKNISKSDIQIFLDITAFPNAPLVSDPLRKSTQGLVAISGVLMGCTASNKYTRSTVYFCKLSTCPNISGQRYQPPYNTSCPYCCSQMEEDVRSVDIGEEITGQIICLSAFSNSGRFQSVKVKIRDEHCSRVILQIGREYTLTGVFEENSFLVWSITYKPPRFEILSQLGSLHSVPLPNSVSEFYYKVNECCPQSPWSFVGALSSTLGSDVLPVSSFLQLKIGLLLSLATQNSDDPPVSLVVVGPDTSAAQKLISSAGQLAERFINYSAGYEQLGGDKRCVTREGTWYEAGAIILASTGVCNLGDWSRFRKDQCSYIFQAVESGRIMLNSTDKGKTEADFVPLRGALWTYWGYSCSSNQDSTYLRMLVNVFGMPFLAYEISEMETKKLSRKILGLSVDETNQHSADAIPILDMKEFISLINSRQLVLSDKASKLIHDFFVIIRKERPECLPIIAIKTITSLAEAHARLSLRNEILYEDVVAVLYLYNISISILFGSSVIPMRLPEYDESEPVYKAIHLNVENFQKTLEEYLENYLFF